MELFTIVRPEHLNHYGSLFGGQMLKWIDEFAYLAAMREFPGCMLVTRAMDDVSFTRGVRNGALLRFSIARESIGHTSVTYRVDVFARDAGKTDDAHAFGTSITFVSINERQEKVPVPAPLEQPGLP
jgi:acyl-CoA hydrolase